MSALPPLMSLLGAHALLVVNAVTRSLKSTARSRVVQISTMIGFDPAANSIQIRSTKIGFDPNSVHESVRTLFRIHKDENKIFKEDGTTGEVHHPTPYTVRR